MTRGFVFPGQGSQRVGMGRAIAEAYGSARAVFDEVDEALGQPLSRLLFEGPEAELTLTENAQPALMAVSLATLRALETEGGFALADRCAFVAGHSVGEYSALAAAGSLALADTARLLRHRGLAMQRAVPVGEGAMAALLGLEAVPLFVRGWFKILNACGAVIVGALALINLFSWSGYGWVLWPASLLIIIEMVRRSSFRYR